MSEDMVAAPRTTKREVMEDAAEGKGCLGRAADDEPVFVLRAQDEQSTSRLKDWIWNYQNRAGANPAKLADARAVLDEFNRWRSVHADRVKVPY